MHSYLRSGILRFKILTYRKQTQSDELQDEEKNVPVMEATIISNMRGTAPSEFEFSYSPIPSVIFCLPSSFLLDSE